MNPAHLVQLAITGSIVLLVFALGLRATPEEATYLLRRPAKFARAVISMYVVVPAVATLLALSFEFRRPVEIALLATAVSPVPPILPGRQLKLGGHAGYVFGLLVAMALCAIVTVPLSVRFLGWIAGRDAGIDASEVARLLGQTILAPLLAGLLVRRVAPLMAGRASPILSKVGSVLLLGGLLPILVTSAPAMWLLVGNGTIVAVLAVVAAAVGAGHWLGGEDRGERRALAVACAMRHPGVALAIGRLNFPDDTLIPAAVLVFVLQAAIVTSLYGLAVRHRRP